MRRTVALLGFASLFSLSLAALWPGTAVAAPPDSCQFEESTGVLSANGGAPGYGYLVQREFDSQRILFRNSDGVPDPCIDPTGGARATVLNTDTIRFTGTDADEGLWIGLANGRLAPGATAEGSGVSEIEFEVQMKDGTDYLFVEGSSGPDRVEFDPGGMKLNGDADQDVSETSVEDRGAYGYGGADHLASNTMASVNLYGGDGSDVILGGPGGDDLRGEEANDQIVGAAGSDSLYGGDGHDELLGGSEPDYLYPGRGDDQVDGGADDDTFYSEPGSDGDDVFLGGPGDEDEMSYYYRTTGVVADLQGDADDGSSGENDRIGSDVEAIAGGEKADSLTGNGAINDLYGYAGPDVIRGGDGDDYLRGGPGNDRLFGEADDDLLYGDQGADRIEGGSGYDGMYGNGDDDELRGGSGHDWFSEDYGANGSDKVWGDSGDDTVYYSGRTNPVSVTLNNSADDGEGGEGDNVHSDVEDVLGGEGADTIIGSSADNYLAGGGGGDFISARGGVDSLQGYAGADDLTGGEGYDTIYGGDDGDTIHTADSGAYDYVSCGNGVDDATDNDPRDYHDVDCEMV